MGQGEGQTGIEGEGSTQAAPEGALGIVADAPEQTVEAPEQKSEPEFNPKETPRETVARVVEEAKAKEALGSEGGAEATEGDSARVVRDDKGKFTKQQEKDSENDAFDPDLSPPERFRGAAKQLFHNLPKGLKRELNKTVRDLEGMTTREKQEIAREREETRSIRDSITPYLAAWGHKNLTAPAAISALAAAHTKLMDPKTRMQTYLALGADLGIDVTSLAEQHGGAAQNNLPHPEIENLRAELSSVKEWKQAQEKSHFDSRVQSIASEIEAVRDEKDAAGNLKYPGLEVLWESVKPLVSEKVRTAQGRLSYADATRQSYAEIVGRLPSDSGQLRTGLPPANNTTQRATQAAISVRGRSAPAVSTANGFGEAPPEALLTPQATVKWVAQQIARNGGR